jgi:uncharacterized membrane protein (UPF0136 family)
MTRNNRWLIPLAVAAGVVLIALAVLCFVEPAKSLPSVIPAFVVGLGCFVFAWFQGGPRQPSPA